MDIREAIEKAGPGAIRRRSWGEEYAIRYMAKGWVNVKSSDDKHPEGERAYITITDALELDWEVVQDEVIEVGDIVQGPCDKEGEVLGVECEVLKHGKILTRLGLLGENSICCCNKYLTKDLTLIRKGPKVKKFKWEIEGGKPCPPLDEIVSSYVRNMATGRNWITVEIKAQ
jgi:uncharacterized protein YuzE